MLPALHLHVPPWHVEVSLYAVALALAVVAGLGVAVRRAAHPDAVLVAAPLAVAAGVAASAAWHRVVHGAPGLSSLGGIGGGLVAVALAARSLGTPMRDLLDAVVPGAVAGFGVGRVGCLLAGCCYGAPTTLAWGIVVPALGSPPRHPVQLLEAAADVALAWWSAGRRGPSGTTAGRAMVGYAIVRTVLEPLRDPASSDVAGLAGVPLAHVGALVLAVAGIRLAAIGRPRLDGRESTVGR